MQHHGIWHFSFTVSDLDAAVRFYRDVLGFELVHVQDQDNDYTRNLVGYPDARLRVAQLAVPGQPRGVSSHDLELVHYLRPIGEPLGAERHRPGAPHLAIAVDSAYALWERLAEHGCTFVSPTPQAITEGVNAGGYAFYFLGPDDVTLECVQPPAHRLSVG